MPVGQVVSGLVAERSNRQILLRRRPKGLVAPDDVELVRSPSPQPAEGEALLRTTYVGLDAAVRTWLDDRPGYLPPVQLGEVIRAAGIGEVVESRCDAFAVGDVVTTLTGFQDFRPHSRRHVQYTRRPGTWSAGGHVGIRPDRSHGLLRHDGHR